MIKMSTVDFNKVSDKQILEMKKAVQEDYLYIMNNRNERILTDNFKNKYYSFYLKARFAKFSKGNELYNKYFNLLTEKLKNGATDCDLMGVIDKLKGDHEEIEFSVSSKLLHTANPAIPIYDSTVASFLNHLWHKGKTGGLKFTQKAKKDKVEEYWRNLIVWYDKVLKGDIKNEYINAEEWINWFNDKILENENTDSITPIKKIDFIIFKLGDWIIAQVDKGRIIN